jgi:hypothetical protein
MRWDFHGLTVEGIWDDAPIGERWLATFAPHAKTRGDGLGRLAVRPAHDGEAAPARPRPIVPFQPDLVFHLALVGEVPPAPPSPPDFQQGELLAYYLNGANVTAHFPHFGQLQLNLANGTTMGCLTPAALAAYGVFEDLLAIGLSPHFRRRGMFLIHAFAAVTPFPCSLLLRTGEGPGIGAILLIGEIGAGKTTTGLALLHAGWKLLSNDSPILTQTLTPNSNSNLKVLSYPGLLSAYPDTLARFPELRPLDTAPEIRQKILFAAESIYPDVWQESARPAAIFFPHIEPRADHALEPLPAPIALQMILPHAVEQWDREMIPAHLALLNQLIQSTPAYRLRLGPNINTIPATLASVL